jgi:hypothetical protein
MPKTSRTDSDTHAAGVPVTPAAALYAATHRLILDVGHTRKGVYLRVLDRRDQELGRVWEWPLEGKWRAYPTDLGKKYRKTCDTLEDAMAAILAAPLGAAADAEKGKGKGKGKNKKQRKGDCRPGDDHDDDDDDDGDDDDKCPVTSTAVLVVGRVEPTTFYSGEATPLPNPVEQSDLLSPEAHLDDLIRHITLVRNACVLLGRRLMARGRMGDWGDGLLLIARGHCHDHSKFAGIEWDWLHSGPNTPKDKLELARQQHTATNDHHPEFSGGIQRMPRMAMAEMVCDWFSRSQERGSDLRQWIASEATKRYGFCDGDPVYKQIMEFVELLIIDPFVK